MPRLRGRGHGARPERRRAQLAAVADDVTLVSGDLADPAGLRRLVADVAPDELYHLAAPTFVPASWEDPADDARRDRRRDGDAARGRARGHRRCACSSRPRARCSATRASRRSARRRRCARARRTGSRSSPRTGSSAPTAKHGLHASSAITYNHESPRRPERFLPRKVTRGAAAIALGLEGRARARRPGRRARLVRARGRRARSSSSRSSATSPATTCSRAASGARSATSSTARSPLVGLDPAGHVRVDPAFVRPPEAHAAGRRSVARARARWAGSPRSPSRTMIGGMVEADLAALRATAR